MRRIRSIAVWVARGFDLIKILAAGTLPKRSTRSNKSMQLMRLVPALLLFLVLGVLGSVVGCGSKSQQVALDKEDENGMLVERKGIRTFHKQQRESAKANSAGRKNSRSP